MARAGLGDGWECAFANDFDPMKGRVYADNWGSEHLQVADINTLSARDLPAYADLAWASFPCQDLSVAGNAVGLGTEDQQTRSGAFWAFWRIMLELRADGRAPALIVLENVYGVLTSNGGRDFALIARSLALAGYRFGAVLLDAVDFVPQSRPRIFIIAALYGFPDHLCADGPTSRHPPAMAAALDRLAEWDRDQWDWIAPPPPAGHRTLLTDIIETNPTGVAWHSAEQTARLIAMMSGIGQTRLAAMRGRSERVVGTIYKRTRRDAFGRRVQRAELRDDQVAGCLRTPGGGSSRQTVIIVDGDVTRSRLLSAREAARLMGLPDTYRLPSRYNDAYHVAGDGLVVPAVRYLAANVLEPTLTKLVEGIAIAAE